MSNNKTSCQATQQSAYVILFQEERLFHMTQAEMFHRVSIGDMEAIRYLISLADIKILETGTKSSHQGYAYSILSKLEQNFQEKQVEKFHRVAIGDMNFLNKSKK